MRYWANHDELVAAVAYALGQLRPLLRQIIAERHPFPDSNLNPSTAAAERIVEDLERSRYGVRERADKPRRHRTPQLSQEREPSGALLSVRSGDGGI